MSKILLKLVYLSLFICSFSVCLLAQEEPLKPELSPTPTPAPTKDISDYFGELEFDASGRLPNLVKVIGKVVDVHDGDTIRVLDDAKTQYKCRFNGIDAPELKQDFGNRSKKSLSDLVFGKIVEIQYDKIDKYGRFVCKVLVDGSDVNLEQVRRGMAWHYKKYELEQTPEDRKNYAEAEINARNLKLGLWAQPNPTEPGAWRRGENNPNLNGVPKGSIVGNLSSR